MQTPALSYRGHTTYLLLYIMHRISPYALCIVWILDFSSLCSLKWKWNRRKQNSFTTFSFLTLNVCRWSCDSLLDLLWLTLVTGMSHIHILSLPWLYVAEHRPHVLTHTRWVMILSLSYLFPVLFKPGPLLTSEAKSPSPYFPWTPTHVRVIHICLIVAVIYFV